jgi:CheY-like chemotaxis protein
MTDERQPRTILVVDDNLDIRAFAKKFLEIAGYAVITAADGEEGIRFYQQHQSSIALLLTDVRMPNMNGLELAHRVRKIDSNLPVLLMSGDARCDWTGLECVPKPLRPADLIATVSRALHAKAQRASA